MGLICICMDSVSLVPVVTGASGAVFVVGVTDDERVDHDYLRVRLLDLGLSLLLDHGFPHPLTDAGSKTFGYVAASLALPSRRLA